ATREELALLGTDDDEVIASRIGRTAIAVRLKRRRVGIPTPPTTSGCGAANARVSERSYLQFISALSIRSIISVARLGSMCLGRQHPARFQSVFLEVAMTKVATWLVCAVTTLFVFGMMARAEDEKIPLDKVPEVVRNALTAKYPKAEVVDAEKGD